MNDNDTFDKYLARGDIEVLNPESYPINFKVFSEGCPDMTPGSETVIYINADAFPTPVNQAVHGTNQTAKSFGYNRILSIRDSSNSFTYLPSTNPAELPNAALDISKPGHFTVAKFVRVNIDRVKADREHSAILLESLCAMERRTISEGLTPREEQRVRLKALEYLSKCQNSDSIIRDVYCLYVHIPLNDLVLKRAYYHKGFNFCLRLEDPSRIGNLYVFNTGRNEDSYIHPHSEANDYHVLMDRLESFRKAFSSTRIKIVATKGKYFDRCGYHVQYDRIREIPITEPNDSEAEGIYFYRNDPLSRESVNDNYYPLSSAEELGIFRSSIEADSHAQKWRAKYIADKTAEENERRADTLRQQDSIRRDEADTRKSREEDSKRNLDRLKTWGAVIGCIATALTAAYGIFKIFSDIFSDFVPNSLSSLFTAR